MFDFDPVTGNQLDSTSRSIMIKSMCMDFDLVDLGKMLLRSKKRKRAKEVGSWHIDPVERFRLILNSLRHSRVLWPFGLEVQSRGCARLVGVKGWFDNDDQDDADDEAEEEEEDDDHWDEDDVMM